jgi:hypothetical protein
MKVKTQWEECNSEAIQTLAGDGQDYQILYDAALEIADVPGLTCEVGVRAGGGSRCIIDAIQATQPLRIRTHIGIDPYGGLDYPLNDDQVIENAYETVIRDMAIPDLYRYCAKTKVNFHS